KYLLADSPPAGLTLTRPPRAHLALWDATTWKEARQLGPAPHFSFSGDGARLALGGQDERDAPFLRVVETATGKEVFAVSPAAGPVAVALSPDGQALASASGGWPVIDVWDVKGRRLLRKLRGHTGQISALAFTPDGKRLASSCTWDGTVKFWDYRD